MSCRRQLAPEAQYSEKTYFLKMSLRRQPASEAQYLYPAPQDLSPGQARHSRLSHTQGRLQGNDVSLEEWRKVIEIISPIADTPAYRAGLKAGDLITHVDGVSIKGRDVRYAVKMLRGKPNTDVRLTIQRQGVRPFDVTITRAIIQIESVKWQAVEGVGVVRITHFISNSEQALERALQKIFRITLYTTREC